MKGRYLVIERNPSTSDDLSAFPYRIVLHGSNRDYDVSYIFIEKAQKGFRAGPFSTMRKYDDIPTFLLEYKNEEHARREARFHLRALALKIAIGDKSIQCVVDKL